MYIVPTYTINSFVRISIREDTYINRSTIYDQNNNIIWGKKTIPGMDYKNIL